VALPQCEIIKESAMDYKVQALRKQMYMNTMYIDIIQK